MRVIAGLYKRRILMAPDGYLITRPTSDRVKENIFNIIAFDIEGRSVLDLFAGTGALGIEALSRGAKHAVFVENNRYALRALQQNIESLKIPANNFRIVSKNVDNFLNSHTKQPEKFDLILADPPYDSDWPTHAVQQLEDSGYCSDACLFVLEKQAPVKTQIQINPDPSNSKNWSLQDMRTYGKTLIEFWRRTNDQIVN